MLVTCLLALCHAYLLELFNPTSDCSDRQSLHSDCRGDFVVPHALMAIKHHRDFLTETVSHLNCALYHGIYAAPLTNSLRPFFSPGMGSSLNSYLEVLLYKFPR